MPSNECSDYARVRCGNPGCIASGRCAASDPTPPRLSNSSDLDWALPVITCAICDRNRDPLDVPDAACGHDSDNQRIVMVPVIPRRVTDEMVERAARAANLDAGRQRGLAFEDDWQTITEQERGGWRLVARAALVAAFSTQQEPTPMEAFSDDEPRVNVESRAWSRKEPSDAV